MPLRRRAARLLPGALLLVAGAARAELPPAYGGTARAPLLSEIARLDPASPEGPLPAAALLLVPLLFDGLYALDGQGRPAPHLAEAAPSGDATGRQVTLRLRAGVVAHGGRAVGAADVARALARAARAPDGWALAPIDEVRADGDGALVVRLARAAPDLPALLATPGAAIALPGGAPQEVVGTGPFSLAARGPGGALALAAHAAHFGGRPFLDRVELRAFGSREAEAAAFEVGSAELSLRGATVFPDGRPKLAAAEVESAAVLTVYLGVGASRPILADPELRLALDRAIDRAALRRMLTRDRAIEAATPVAPALGGPSTRPRLDLAQARAALGRARARAGAAGGALATPLRLELLVDRTRPEDREVAAKLLWDLARIGVEASVSAVAPADYAARRKAQAFDLCVGLYAPPSTDPGLVALGALVEQGDGAWVRAALRRGPADLAAALGRLAERRALVPLVHRALRAHHVTTLRGVAFDALGRLGLADASFRRAAERGAGRAR